jgi:ferric-dicitrate binding protein FerR (iron transport regulator)
MRQETLIKLFEGTASLEEQEKIRKWLDESPDNNRLFIHARKMFDASIVNGSSNQLSVERTSSTGLKHSIAFNLLKIAAIVAITLCCTYLYSVYQKAHEPIAMQSISVPAGQRIDIKLSDGTDVWLNAGTTLRYPVKFEKKRVRQVYLDGEAYFSVSKDKEWPFRVQTPRSSLEVLGTQFNVEDYSNYSWFDVALMEGSVKVSATTSVQEPLVLTPDKRAYFDHGKLVSGPVEDSNLYRWREGLILFQEPFFQRCHA